MTRKGWQYVGILLILGAMLLLWLARTEAQGSVLYVMPGGTGGCDAWADACSLQAAIAVAESGEEIWVAAGTYTPGITRTDTFQLENGVALYGGFAGTEASREERDWEANPTVLSGDLAGDDGPEFANNGENSYHVVTGSGTDATATLDGFTITGGNANGSYPHYLGGGMYNSSGSPTLVNVTFSGNTATWHGGGMYNSSGSPLLSNCTFTGNSADGVAGNGGGMYNVSGSAPTLTGCTFAGNNAASEGGGIYNHGSSPVLIDCGFSGNSASWGGGGMTNRSSSSPTLTDCTFVDNSAGVTGGGMYSQDSSPTLTNCAFAGNSAGSGGGGGMVNWSTSATLTNCTFSGNSTGGGGGGMYNTNSSFPVITNCTFSGNSTTGSGGGGMRSNNSSSPTLTNSVLWGNTPDELGNFLSSVPVVAYSNIQGSGGSGSGWDTNLGTDGGGNKDADPLFVDADGPDDNPGTSDDDLRLQIPSPAIDAGDNTAILGGVTTDLAGNPRLTDVPTVVDTGAGVPPIVDMGAYEVQEAPPPVIYVNADATGANAGTSWADAFTDLQDALTWAVDGVEVWVAEGTYLPTSSTDRAATFHLVSGVGVYGGFDPSAGDTEWGDRDWVLHETILSGDIGTPDDDLDNVYHVLTGYEIPQLAVLDGFTITGGYAENGTVWDDSFGGGLFAFDAQLRLENLSFEGNTAGRSGGGLYVNESNATLVNVTFSRNSANSGGGFCVNSSEAALTNVTFSGNSADFGGGIYNASSSPTLTNCILWGNEAPAGAQLYNQNSSPVVTYSDIQGGYTGTGNTDADPLFVDAYNGDLHLGPGSPCIDAGTNLAPDLPAYDFEGDARIVDGDHDGTPVVDMGVDEAQYEAPPPAVIYVDADASGANDGTSWADAFTDLQDALTWAVGGVQIWVAEGTYKPSWQFDAGDPRSATFQLKNEVAIHGGFDPSVGDIGFTDRDWASNVTILSGDLAGDDGPDFTNNGENSYHVFFHPTGTDLDATAVLDGFTITDGNANGINPHSNGGGMYNDGSSPTLSNCTFSGNLANTYGGGMYNYESSPVLTTVTFSGNKSEQHGGGMLNHYYSSPMLTNCTFSGNSSVQPGGGMLNHYFSSPTLTNCTFSGNSAGSVHGGGMANSEESSPVLTNCTFSGNSANSGGGMSNVRSSNPTLINCTFTDNGASYGGGGMYNEQYSSPTLTNCTFSGNSAGQTGGGMYNFQESSPTLTNCTFSGNSAGSLHGGGMANWHISSPTLTNCTFSGNSASIDGGAMYNHGSSPALTNCILWGDTSNEIRNEVGGSPVVTYSDIQGGYTGTGNIDADPMLGRLADNGGPTLTYALLAGSPARDAGDPVSCTAADQRSMERPRDGDGDGTAVCDMGAFEAGPANDAWNRAQTLDLSSGSATVYEYVDQLGQSRWYKFQVAPGSRVTAEMVPPDANLDIALFGDIQAAYDELLAPTGESDLVQLNAEFAADAFSPFAYSPFAYSPFAYSPFAYSPFAYSPFAYSPFAYSPFAYSPFAYSPFAYSPFAYSPFAYSPFAYSPFAYSPFAYSPFAYSPFAYSPDPAYSSAQVQTLMAISAFDGTASELIEVNTWDNRGEFYLRVSGRNGAFDLSEPFTLRVTQDMGICGDVSLISRPSSPTAPDGDYQALFLTDWSRFDQGDPTLEALQAALPSFASAVGGTVVDVGQDPYVLDANAEADATPQCPYAKNQVAWLIKDIVTAYRDAGNPVEYVVLVGNDDVIPYFRYPDRAELGSEKDYKPPVLEGTSSYASLTLGYVLSQDAYGSTLDLALSSGSLPIPDLAVGRLVETPAEILNMLDTYALHGGSLAPASALVTGYDFLEDAAHEIRAELEAGLGVTADALITPDTISPQDRDGVPPLDAPWPAPMLRDLLLGSRHDLIFLAGHFTAQGALAADYETRLWASELLDPSVDLENALVYSAGCHSGYNIVNQHGVPYVTVEPDWAQAFAQAGATFIGGTGYQYGDTDFLEYSERLYLEFTRELRCGTQPQSVGQALVEAKQAYLAGTAQMRGIHEKALLEATLFGLPMLQINGLSGAGCLVDPPSEVTSTESYPGEDPTPGQVLELRYADLAVDSNLSLQTLLLRSVVDPAIYPDLAIDLDTTYFSGTDGAVTNPAEPVLPLERRNVDVPGYVLRGVGFRGGTFADLPGMIPVTGAATTETRAAHTPFQSDVLYPLQPWSVNYFAQLADPDSGITWLDVMPAQFVSDADGNLWTGTWRRFDDMEFRLFYSNHVATLTAGAVPSLAAPPAVLKVLASSGADEVHFQVTVAGDLAAGIQEVWVTYTGMPCEGDTTCWQSLDLVQNAADSTLWDATLSLNGTPPGEVRYMVQAVNGVGLVSLITNEGQYFRVDVDPANPAGPADPAGGDDPAMPPESTYIEFQAPPSSGAHSTEAEFSAVLRTSGGAPVEGERLTFALGAQQRSAVTGSDGSATVPFPLHALPGDYDVSATFAGGPGYERSSATSPFTILKQGAALTFLEVPGVAQYSDDVLMSTELTDADENPLSEMTVLFLFSGGGQSYAVSGITDFLGQAVSSHVPLPPGSYQIEASFGQAVTVNGLVVDLTNPNYDGASAPGPLIVISPEDATVTYTGETVVTEGSTTLNLAAMVTQADDGAPGDLSLAWVHFEVLDQNGKPLAAHQAQAAGDGTVVATLTDLSPGTYQVSVTVFGGYFASDPAPQVAGLSLPLEPVELDSSVSGSAYFIDPDSVDGHTAIWDWGDGTTCDTSVGGACALTEPSASTAGEVTGSHTYAEPGVYTVQLAVTDGEGYTAEATYEFVVIYDPGGGFVTGGGWIWSAGGWCQLDDLCGAAEGKANFGFVSRYKKGATVPTGTTEFNFSAGGLNFHSDSYEWLLVNQAGTNAQFKGSGIVNGGASPDGDLYKFMIWAADEDPYGGDTFRIKIWYEDDVGNEVTVYDNGLDQALGGGSIVIHKPD